MLHYKDEEFINSNLGLVHSCCRRFSGRGIEYDDLFQAGCMGLVKAARDFDEGRGFMFSTYAVPVILGEVKRLFRDSGSVKVSRSLKELSIKVTVEKENFQKNNGRPPTVTELSELLGTTPELINEAICVSKPTVSLTFEDDDGEREFELPSGSEEAFVERIAIKAALHDMGEQDRRLIIFRYFVGLTQSETASRLSMTQVQVSRREKKLLEEMKRRLE